MNIYDFDGTIYYGDSTYDFYKFCVREYGLLKTVPNSLLQFTGLFLHLKDKTTAKQAFYNYYRYIPEINIALEDFWSSHERKLKPWYTDCFKRPDDIIISASPEFQLAPICRKLGVKLIASRVDKYTGVYTGQNCEGKEKVRRLYEQFPGAVVDKFYSDSRRDTPLARIAKEAFMVKDDLISPWK